MLKCRQLAYLKIKNSSIYNQQEIYGMVRKSKQGATSVVNFGILEAHLH
jgi:hypothetical protein